MKNSGLGQEASYKKLFHDYYPRLCDFARSFIGEDCSEDVVQDVFIAYFERRETVSDRPESIKSFFYQSVKNACLNKLRGAKVVEKYEVNHQAPLTDEQHALTEIVHAEVVGEIHQALKKLPEGCRIIIRLGYFEGLNNPQIAQELNISVNTVKSQKQRALALLRTHLSVEALTVLVAVVFFEK